MLIGHSMPHVNAVVLSSTVAGAAFVGGTQDGLTDGLPARETRLQWMTAGGQTVDDALRISLRFSGVAQQIRVAAALGVRLPSGTKVRAELYDGHAGALLSAIDARLSRSADGSYAAWFLWPAAVGAALRVDFVVYNDVNGLASIAAGTLFEIGELTAMPVLSVPIESDFKIDPIDPSEADMSRDAQAMYVQRQGYRRFESTFSADGFAAVFGGSLVGGMDWMALQAATSGDQRTIAIPRWSNDGATVDSALVRSSALYGVGRVSAFEHIGSDWYRAAFALDEIPAQQ